MALGFIRYFWTPFSPDFFASLFYTDSSFLLTALLGGRLSECWLSLYFDKLVRRTADEFEVVNF